MLVLKPTTKFRKDYKLMKNRGYKMDLLEDVLEELLQEQPLAEKYRDHALVGNYTGFRECHILSDWLLIYQVDKERHFLVASRTGTHSDLFNK